MRRPDAVAIVLLAALASAGCSRVAFVKTDPSRQDYNRTAEDVEVHETDAGRNRANARNALLLSQQRLTEGDYANAEKYAKQALQADPQSADANTMLAVISDQQGRRDQSGAYYQRAAQLAPNGGTYNNYGAWLCANQHVVESLTWFDQAIADPAYSTPAAALANAGRCALDAGQPERAQRDLRRALELDATNPVALDALARSEFRAARYFEARAFSERRLAAAPATAEALLLASQIEDKLGDSAAAARYGRRLREEFPGVAQGNAGGSKSP